MRGEVYLQEKINEIYEEKKYFLFRDYCEKNNIVLFSDITRDKLEYFYQQKGIGINKYTAVINLYNEYIISKQLNIDLIDVKSVVKRKGKINKRKYDISAVNKALLAADLELLEFFGFTRKQISAYNKKGFTCFEQVLEEYSNLSSKCQALLDSNYAVFCLSSAGLLNYLMSEIVKQHGIDIFISRVNGASLQKIGDSRGITRERVRQISYKIEEKVRVVGYLFFNCFYNKKKILVTMKSAQKILSDEYLNYIKYSFKRSKRIVYIDFLNSFALYEDASHLEQVLLKLKNETLSACILKKDALAIFKKVLNISEIHYVNSKQCLRYFLSTDYRLEGQYLVKNNISYAEIVAEIVKTDYPQGVSLYDSKTLQELRQKAIKKFPSVKLPNKDRAFTARLAEFLVLCDRGKYTHIDNFRIDDDLLEKIVNYINHSDKTTFIYHEIYQLFANELKVASNIRNHHAIHGILKYYHKDEYQFERDVMYKINTERISISNRIEDFVRQQSRVVTLEELQAEFPGITLAMIFNAVLLSDGMIQWNSNCYYHLDNLDITPVDKKQIAYIIKNNFEHYGNYCSDYLLYTDAKQSMAEFLKRNKINNQASMFYIVMKLFKDEYSFRRPHIYKSSLKDDKKKALWIAIDAVYDGKLSYNEYLEYARKVGWTPATTYNIFYSMLKHLFRLSEDEYIKLEEIKVTVKSINKLDEILLPLFKTQLYVPLFYDFSDIQLELFGFNCNGYIIESLINNFKTNYKILYPEKSDRRFLRGIIVENNCIYDSYEELVFGIIGDDLYTDIDEEKIYQLLERYNLMASKPSIKLLHSIKMKAKKS